MATMTMMKMVMAVREFPVCNTDIEMKVAGWG